jgi:hypothetical protein
MVVAFRKKNMMKKERAMGVDDVCQGIIII